jgi:hypothetical protein
MANGIDLEDNSRAVCKGHGFLRITSVKSTEKQLNL